ncbi:hypothetical protein [Leptospira noguchii]|uniref:Uncharacterized protein n=1 Tax=Leptospira noguchii TaxID=28182 RepID=A0AAE9KB28_9LEPT|nr:hypothetical protein [Leptospira noguchii]UOG31129.1 hypothetical protein MAL06_03480 [Leptospira noguchii]UOG57242.1 hypothetical protein MAL03_03430 [Leptospira noguchii]
MGRSAGRSTGRVNSAKRFLWVALQVVRQVALTQQNASYGSRFRVNKLNLKTIVVLCFLYAIY